MAVTLISVRKAGSWRSDDADDEQKEPEMNLDEVVQAVYQMIRRRLAIEWERGRGD